MRSPNEKDRDEMDSYLESRGYVKVTTGRTVVNKSYVTSLEKKHTIAKKNRKHLKRGQYHSNTTLERRLIGFVCLACPQTAQHKAEMMYHCIRAAVIEEFNIAGTLQGVMKDDFSTLLSKSGLKKSTVGNLIGECAAAIIFVIREDILDADSVFNNCDKGQGGHLAKVISWYSRKFQRVRKFILDVEKCSGYSDDTALAIKHAIQKIILGPLFRFFGGTQDAGGGGTGYSLKRGMIKYEITTADALVCFCSIHGIQLVFQAGINDWSGKGGLGTRTALQLLHSFYDLQETLGESIWSEYWNDAAKKLNIVIRDRENKVTTKIPWLQEPVDSRWWTIGEGTRLCTYNLDILREVIYMSIERKRANSGEKMMKIAGNALSLILEDEIISDLLLIRGFAGAFLDPHMDWLQGGDIRVGSQPGFNIRNMLVRYFLLHNDLSSLANGAWRSHAAFQDFVTSLKEPITNLSTNPSTNLGNDDTQSDFVENIIDEKTGEIMEGLELRQLVSRPIKDISEQTGKANGMFDTAKLKLHSIDHYTPYRKDLLFLGLFGETPTARIVAHKYLGLERNISENEQTYFCAHQNREIDLRAFNDFLDWDDLENIRNQQLELDWEMRRQSPHIKMIQEKFAQDGNTGSFIEAISSRGSMWDAQTSPPLASLANTYKNKYAACVHQTHFVESAVKTAGLADNSARDDTRASHYAIGANMVEDVNKVAIQAMIKERAAKDLPPYKDEDLIVPRGEVFVRTLVNHMKSTDKTINDLCKNDEKAKILDEIKELTVQTKHAFRHTMTKKTIDEGKEQLKKRAHMKAPKITRATGVDKTEASKGEFAMKKLVKNRHWDMLGEELIKRKILETTDKTFSELRKILQEQIGGKDIKGFVPEFESLSTWSYAPECKQKREQLLKEARKNAPTGK